MKDFLELLHVKHWIKNGFVIAPVIFSFQFLNCQFNIKTMFAFISFCFSSSFVYIINCIHDREKDNVHPVKKDRPIAAGRISVKKAAVTAILLLCPVFLFNLLCNINVLIVIVIYMFINLLYSFKLRTIPILDVILVATGFLLRILAGSFAIEVNSSDWILLTTFFLALFMGFSKRRSEYLILNNNREQHRSVFNFYNIEILNAFIVICAALAIISYALYAIDPLTAQRFGPARMVYTVPFVLLGIFRYLMISYLNTKTGDPVEIILKDKVILIVTALWICLIIIFILIK